jgi:hypothetical protein
MHILGVLLALLIISLLSTTRESRAEAGEYIDRWARWLIIPTLILVGIIAWPFVAHWFD